MSKHIIPLLKVLHVLSFNSEQKVNYFQCLLYPTQYIPSFPPHGSLLVSICFSPCSLHPTLDSLYSSNSLSLVFRTFLLKILFYQISAWPLPSLRSDLCSNVPSSEGPSLPTPSSVALSAAYHLTLLKDRPRGCTGFKSLFEQKLIQIRWHQTSSGQEYSTDRSQGQDLYREGAEAEKGNYLVDCSLKSTWLFVIGQLRV